MELLGLFVLALCSIVGFFAIFFTTFGTLIIMGGALVFALLTDFSTLSLQQLLLLSGLYLIGECFELLSTVIGTKWMGGSNAAVIGSLLGGVAGALVGLSSGVASVFITTLAGLFLGAFLVEWGRKQDVIQAIKVGLGSMLGRISAVVFKVMIALAMFVIIALALLR